MLLMLTGEVSEKKRRESRRRKHKSEEGAEGKMHSRDNLTRHKLRPDLTTGDEGRASSFFDTKATLVMKRLCLVSQGLDIADVTEGNVARKNEGIR